MLENPRPRESDGYMVKIADSEIAVRKKAVC